MSVLEYARETLGLNVKVDGDRTYSLAGGHNPTCLVVHTDWFYDFKTGQGGDVIDLCAIARHGGNKGEAIREMGGSSPRWQEATQNLCNAVQMWHEQLRPEDIEYLHSRRITDATIDALKLGFDGSRLTVPYWKNGYIAYVITRDRGDGGPKYKKAALDGINENIPWGLQTLGRTDKPLVIAEGAFDAMSFYQDGYRVLSPMSGYFNKDALKQVLGACRDGEPVFICFDSDGAGNRFQTTMAQNFFRHHIEFTCGELQVKDISDYYTAGGDLAVLIAAARPGIEVLAEHMTNRDEFKKFVYEAGRFIGRPEMSEFFEHVKGFPDGWLKSVMKTALSAPPDDLILRELTDEYRLKFFDALGFYEYAGGVWQRRGDSEIKKYIADSLGHYKTGSRVSSVFSLLKGQCVSTEQLDRQPLFVFANGTLELVTGMFRDNRESDLCSVSVPYKYDKDAFSQRWLDFIEQICESDERKISLMQEIAGYVLFNDCSLQKCFFLLGDGANGKSVYLDVLSAVFGEKNVSNIEMSGLVEPFQRIRLYNSILNISSETQSDVKGAESIFKQLVVGDAVNGCYKGKDFLEFRTRSKFISACNDYIKSRDVTNGFMRRIVFVNFTAHFVDEPTEGEYKADRELTGRLMEDLPGIFNWAYSGYKILQTARQFSVPEDQRETMDNFARDINPVMSFIEDEMSDAGCYGRSDTYAHYQEWCVKNGHKTLSRTGFVRRLRQTLTQMHRKFEDYKNGNERGFELK